MRKMPSPPSPTVQSRITGAPEISRTANPYSHQPSTQKGDEQRMRGFSPCRLPARKSLQQKIKDALSTRCSAAFAAKHRANALVSKKNLPQPIPRSPVFIRFQVRIRDREDGVVDAERAGAGEHETDDVICFDGHAAFDIPQH